MPNLKFDIPHSLSNEEAKERLQRFMEFNESKLKDQVSDLNQSWDGDTLVFGFKTFGIKIQGRIASEVEKLGVDCELPFSAMMFKGKIESEMRQQIERLLR